MRRFEWDPVKAPRNLRKHGVAFDDVVPVFDDDNAIDELDADPGRGAVQNDGLGTSDWRGCRDLCRARPQQDQDHLGQKGHQA